MMKLFVASLSTVCLFAGTAYAGVPVPIPVAGVTGPIGIGIAVAAYAGYRLWSRNR